MTQPFIEVVRNILDVLDNIHNSAPCTIQYQLSTCKNAMTIALSYLPEKQHDAVREPAWALCGALNRNNLDESRLAARNLLKALHGAKHVRFSLLSIKVR
jgi:hypothetical protein